jgi:putative flippase GtrA
VRGTLARFAVVGSITTGLDIGVFVVLWTGLEWPALGADLLALAVAAAASYGLHRAVTFRGDPYRTELERWSGFVAAVAGGALVDLCVVVGLSMLIDADSRSLATALAVKVPAVVVAGVVRWMLHRWELFLIVRAEQVPDPSRPPAPGDLRLSVLLPAYQEAARIGPTIAAVRSALSNVDGGVEVIVIDDGSGDDTSDRAAAAGADRVVRQPANRGKGAAVRAGINAARGRTVAFTDADLAYSPDQLVPLLETVEQGCDVVVGSRRHDAATTLVRAGRLRELGGRAINWLTYAVLLGGYRDTQCGLKAFRSDAAAAIADRARIDGFAFDIELFVLAERNRWALAEAPVRVVNTSSSTVRPVRDGLRLVRDLFRIRRFARQGAYQAPQPTHT